MRYFQVGELEYDHLERVPPRRFQHYTDLASLRRAAFLGCNICQLFESQINLFLNDVAGFDERTRQFNDVPSDFSLWLTKRPGVGHGLWVMADGKRGPGARHDAYLLAAIGFCVDTGKFPPNRYCREPLKSHSLLVLTCPSL